MTNVLWGPPTSNCAAAFASSAVSLRQRRCSIAVAGDGYSGQNKALPFNSSSTSAIPSIVRHSSAGAADKSTFSCPGLRRLTFASQYSEQALRRQRQHKRPVIYRSVVERHTNILQPRPDSRRQSTFDFDDRTGRSTHPSPALPDKTLYARTTSIPLSKTTAPSLIASHIG